MFIQTSPLGSSVAMATWNSVSAAHWASLCHVSAPLGWVQLKGKKPLCLYYLFRLFDHTANIASNIALLDFSVFLCLWSSDELTTCIPTEWVQDFSHLTLCGTSFWKQITLGPSPATKWDRHLQHAAASSVLNHHLKVPLPPRSVDIKVFIRLSLFYPY